MSSGAQIAILPASRRRPSRSVQTALETHERPRVRLATFAALALYGIIRWSTMISPVPGWRLFGLLGLAVALAAAGPFLARRTWPLALVAAVLSVFAMFALAGIPVRWLTHLRISVTADAIGNGLSALPAVLVPYNGINESVRMVIALGAGVLVLDAAVLLAFAPRALGDLRRAGAALPLVALAVVPSTLVRPQLPYLQGLILFGLLAAFMWGERIRGDDIGTAVALACVAAAAAMILAPSLDRHKPLVDYQALASKLAPAHVDAFDWSQTYGPLIWPRTGRTVLEIKADRPDYWKAENLDIFDGREWIAGSTTPDTAASDPDPSLVRSWTQTLQVTVEAMRSSDVIAAGFAQRPTHISAVIYAGVSAGTWSTSGLGPGDSYQVSAYSPQPTAGQLSSAGRRYPATALLGYLSLELPAVTINTRQGPLFYAAQPVYMPPFGSSSAQAYGPVSIDPGADLQRSPYARAYALAQRLARQAATPYAYVLAVQHYLSTANGFAYSETPPARRYPLESFLFKDKVGYCQQFSGAMALLLRLGGIPARVAAGFATGSYDTATRTWIVTDADAHSWVEAWFPHLGWVKFDPTPAAAPARGGQVPEPILKRGARTSAAKPSPKGLGAATAPTPVRNHPAGSSVSWPAVIGTVIALAAIALLVVTLRHAREPTGDRLLAELERALARTGRPIDANVTLAALEYRFRTAPDAAAYVRALRLARYAGQTQTPTATQRRALRAQLRSGLGLLGFLRAFWALPPRLHS